MKIIPLTVTQVNWPNLLQSSRDVTGRSLVAMLDQERNSDRGAFGFIASLMELNCPGQSTRDAVKNGIAYFAHYFIGFLVECSENESDAFRPLEGLTVSYFQGMHQNRRTDLDLIIVSGTLLEWSQLIKHYRSTVMKDYIFNIRKEFFEQVSGWMNKLSLKEIL